MHFHMHLIPRYDAEEEMISWKPGKPSQEELEETCRQIVK